MLHIRHVSKTFSNGQKSVAVLKDVSVEVPSGSLCALVGPSGSGKSTLLALCAGLERVSSGTIHFHDFAVTGASEVELADFRAANVGFVFQSYQLIPTLTALENVMVPAELIGERGAEGRAQELLRKVGLSERADHYPAQLSGGEQQRVALARAFINQPKLLFGDEPTGNLDAENATLVENLLFELNREQGSTLILATHNPDLAARAKQVIRLKSGEIVAAPLQASAPA
ncbi:MAG: ABC transporter ATP-binding protein [Bdellovibrionota bacterium]